MAAAEEEGAKRRRVDDNDEAQGVLGRCIWSTGEEDTSTGIVCAVGSSSDGDIVFSGSSDTTLRAWDAAKGECLQTIENAHEDWIRALAVAPGGDLLLTGSRDATIRVWRVSSRSEAEAKAGAGGEGEEVTGEMRSRGLPLLRLVGILEGHTDWVRCFATLGGPSPRLFSVSDDCTIREWALSTFSPNSICDRRQRGERGVLVVKECLRVRTSSKDIKSLLVCPDGSCLYIGFSDYTVRCMEMDKGDSKRTFRGHGGIVTCMAIYRAEGGGGKVAANDDSSHGREGGLVEILYTGSDDRTIRQWETKHAYCLRIFHGHKDWIRSILVSKSGDTLYSGSQDREVRVWDTHLEETLAMAKDPEGTSDRMEDNYSRRVEDQLAASISVRTATGLERPLSEAEIQQMRAAVNQQIHMRIPAAWQFTQTQRVLRGHGDAIWSLDLLRAKDECVLVSSSADGTIRAWAVAMPTQWSSRLHHVYSPLFRSRVRSFLMAHKRCQNCCRDSADALHRVFGHCNCDLVFRIIKSCALLERKALGHHLECCGRVDNERTRF